MPVWVALIGAAGLPCSPRDPIVWPALGLALAGLAVILVPDLLGAGVTLSLAGLLAALFAGFGYATYAVSVKGLTEDRRADPPSRWPRPPATRSSCCRWLSGSSPAPATSVDGRALDRRRRHGRRVHRDRVHALDRGHAPGARRARRRSSATSSRSRGRATPCSSSARCRPPGRSSAARLILGRGAARRSCSAAAKATPPSPRPPSRGRCDGAPAAKRAMRSRAAQGYLLVAGSFLIMGLIGALVELGHRPRAAPSSSSASSTAGHRARARSSPAGGPSPGPVAARVMAASPADGPRRRLHAPPLLRRHPRHQRRHRHVLCSSWRRCGWRCIAPRVFRARTERIVYPALAARPRPASR